ncbi:acetylcholine receptor subunit gamma-like [Oncorhynchus nerka]|uniref:acetylcholine receptor subunit gamma-like n=1 Tax=Oncorhynchus nerka TaxID=8023 RepID=UPI0031B85ABC
MPGASLSCNEESKLIGDLFRGYNKSICPAVHPTDKVEVQVKLILTNIISLQWNDIRLAWNTSVYFGIEVIRVPYNTVWLPEIVLENNIDGKFDVAYYANVLIYSSSYMYWLPPAIYRSTYRDHLLLTSPLTTRTAPWSSENGEWAIKHRPARELINSRYTPDDLEYQEISFNLVIQREPLFYIINIILPCSLISSLVVLAYLLPAQDWGQKLTVSISVLLPQTVFLFLIAQKVPETSLNVPLISKYLNLCHVCDHTHRHQPNRVDGIMSTTAILYKSLAQAAPEIKEYVDACNFIAESTKQANDIGSEMESWVLIGKMIDKVCFWVAMALFSIGTVAIFLTGHFNSVPEFPFPGENKQYLPS